MKRSTRPIRLGTGFALACALCAQATAFAATFTVPREKVSLVCTDSYFKVDRVDFALPDETYTQCSCGCRWRCVSAGRAAAPSSWCRASRRPCS
ncbi:hypothetical protein [Deinococcus alpinitundrae]|uniref:hypothetical protein n=1 Tax=Deinococcus alpinitundrae TaxID=468913 RepID=UPI00137AB48A|nr:hypothetical protein [Deinococcus alpinitundrae]